MTKRKRYVTRLKRQFTEQWNKEYLPSLRERQQAKKVKKGRTPSVDDVVIVHEEKQPRQRWNLGRVTELFESNNGQIRSAAVKLGKTGNVIRRPINKLYPILQGK